MGRSLVVSAAVGYEYAQVRLFLTSLLRNTYSDLLLITSPLAQAEKTKYLLSPRVRVVEVRLRGEPSNMVVARFAAAKDAIEHSRAEEVLLCDSRDVFFQGDPFQAGLDSTSLCLAEEPRKIKECGINSGWLMRYYDKEAVRNIGDRPIICAGTILGARTVMTAFLHSYCERLDALVTRHGGIRWGMDQACLNHFAWAEQGAGVPLRSYANTSRFALTLYHQSSLRLDTHGRLCNDQDEVVPVIHQYDRYPWLSHHLENMLS